MPPLFASWAEAFSTEMVGEYLFLARPNKIGLNLGEDLFSWSSPNFGQKIGLNLSEDLFFFFWSSPKFGRKIGLNLSEDLLFGLHLMLERSD